MKRLLAAAALAATTFAVASAHHDGERFQVGNLTVSHAYIYENAEMAHSVRVYLTIHNTGETEDRLLEATVDFADQVFLEGQAIDAEGTLSIKHLEGVAVAPGQTVTFQPGALWIELESVHETFEHGEHFDMALTFEKAGTVEIEVEVEEAPGAGHRDDDRHGKPAS